MKKFLVFLVSIVVVVCLGLTTYYFMRNDEVINFSTKEIYANVGDIISLDDLGYGVTKQYHKTTYNYNAGGEPVTSVIEYDDSKGFYVAKAGGDVDLVIATSNSKFAEFKINVHIGNGSELHPYYISNQADLELIGDTYLLDAHYSMRNDVTVSSTFAPIGQNKETQLWAGFSGTFNGNGYSINGLSLIDGAYDNAGLFSTINAGAKVTDLVINNVTINGNYTNAGALAGVVAGEVARVQVNNVDITNFRDASNTGAMAGRLDANASLTVSSADNATITINREAVEGEDILPITAVAGGLVGTVDSAKVQATFADTTINLFNATGKIGGLVGELVLGTNVGTIAESYSTSTSNYADFGAFIGTISKGDTFNAELAKELGYINGNYVVSGTYPVVKNDTTNLFTTYYDATNSIYFIVDFADVNSLMANNEYVFFALSQEEKVTWDSLVWNIKAGSLPILRMTTSSLSTVTQEYLTRDISKETIGDINKDEQTNAQIFLNYIATCREADGAIKDKKYTLATDVDLTGHDYATIDLINSVFDGNGKTITVDLSTAAGDNLGLFGKVENSTIKNLTIKVIGLTDAKNVGALAGEITTTGDISVNVQNITIEFPAEAASISATNFGGVAGKIANSVVIDNVKVSNLTIDANANIVNVAGLVADNGATIKNATVETTALYAREKVAGAVAINNGTLDNANIKATVAYTYNGAGLVGGLVALNNNSISNSTFEGSVKVTGANGTMYVGGAAAKNNGTISDTTMKGEGISIANTVSNTFYIGGVVAENNATITGAIVNFDNIGTYIQGKLHYVGGIAATNSGAASNINNSVVTSNISGNYVAGIVAEMNNGGAKVDQVFVGKSLTEQNIITGDKMVAGLVYNFVSGEMTNIQATSEIKGQTTDTLSSLIVLEFPAHATLINATINSSLNGNGTFYLDTWADKTNEGNGANYNVFEAIGSSGVIKSVTINEDAAEKYGKDIKRSEFTTRGALFFYQIPTYDVVVDGVKNTNYYKLVSDAEFNTTNAFKTNCEMSRGGTGVLMLFTAEYNYAMQYDFLNSIWSDNDDNTGIKLAFLKLDRFANAVTTVVDTPVAE